MSFCRREDDEERRKDSVARARVGKFELFLIYFLYVIDNHECT